ncbi:hypothetical protein GCM10007971_29440 [Oceanobacillus indicireducens]|uniref:Uncharacterized protein n=1 Tax=Oceanobacillus indicireducens TaxID=1004261 RepID=A0A918D374_9BACI|nr:hypothetical protein GCM10007971_29440 [Oceanobacillus indicireducens]
MAMREKYKNTKVKMKPTVKNISSFEYFANNLLNIVKSLHFFRTFVLERIIARTSGPVNSFFERTFA